MAMKFTPKNIALSVLRRVPFIEAPFERWNFRRKILRGATMTARAKLAARFLRGQGAEIGALHLPLPLPDGAHARYVDSLTVEGARQHYPELRWMSLVPVSVLDDGEVLSQIAPSSLDFLVANHVLEHCQNPLGTLQLWLGKLRPNGVLFCAVPDGRFTFDRERPLTTPEHLWRDFEDGPQNSYQEHLREWTRSITKPDEAEFEQSVAQLKESRYSIHFHVWDFDALGAMLQSLQARGWPLKIEALERNGDENIFVLRKVEANSP